MAGVVVVVLGVGAVRGQGAGKTWDHAIYVLALAVGAAAVVGARSERSRSGRFDTACALIGAAGLACGIGVIEKRSLGLIYMPSKYWMGFGFSVLAATSIMCLVIWRLVSWKELDRRLRVAVGVIVALVCAVDIPSLLRTSGYLNDVIGNSYVVNEVLAPSAGRTPDANFVPQYDVLYGWVLKPWSSLLSPHLLVDAAVALLSVLGLIAVGLGVVCAHRALAGRSLAMSAAIVVALTCVTTRHGAAPQGSIAVLLQDLSVRLLGGLILGWFGLEELARLRVGAPRRGRLLGLGLVAGLVAWNSQDFGVAAVVVLGALFLGSVVGTRPSPDRRRRLTGLAWWLLGLGAGLLAYPAFSAAIGTPINLRYLEWFELQFAGGFASVPIYIPGPVLFVLPVLVATAGVGWFLVLGAGRPSDEHPGRDIFDKAALTAAFFGTWALLGFIYYLNRSFASGQMQILLLPTAVGIVALISLALHGLPALDAGRAWHDLGPLARSLRLRLLPITVAGSLTVAAAIQTPSPRISIDRLVTPPVYESYPAIAVKMSIADVRAAQAYARAAGDGRVDYFGEDGNYIQLATGIESMSLFNNPMDFKVSRSKSEGCRYLLAQSPKWLVVSQLAASVFPNGVCGAYSPMAVSGVAKGRVEERR